MPGWVAWNDPTPTSGSAWEAYTTASLTQVSTNHSLWTSATTVTAPTTSTVWWNASNGDIWVDNETYMRLAHQRVVVSQVRTAEQQRLDRERREIERRVYQERMIAHEAAKTRSKELLLSHLTPAQKDTFEKNHWFIVEGGKSRQLYRIRNSGSVSGNIDVLEGKPGKVTHRLCCHLRAHDIPLFDHLLAQKVWIESDEDAFLRQANRHAA